MVTTKSTRYSLTIILAFLPHIAHASFVTVEFWTGAFYTFCTLVILLALLMVVFLKQPRWLPYCLMAALTTSFVATSEGTLSALLGATDAFRHVAQLFLGICLCGIGYLTIADQIESGHPYQRFVWFFRLLGVLVLLMIPMIHITSVHFLYVLLNPLILCMFICQILPAMSWQSLPQQQQRYATAAAALLSLSLCGYYIGWFSGWQFTHEHINLANRLFFAMFLCLSIGYWGMHVLAIENQRIQSLEDAVTSARAEAKTTQALFQAELDYSRAREVARRRGHQLATASHDLRQPLASLRTTLDVLMRDEASETNSRIREAVNYVEQLAAGIAMDSADTGDAGSYSSNTSQEIDAEVSNINVSVLLDNLAQMFGTDATAAGADLKVIRSTVSVSLSPLICMRILSNLLVNAINHSDATKIVLGVRRRSDGIEIQILDNGHGLSPDQAQALMEVGAKGDKSTGSGLGLGIVAELSKQYGYKLTLGGRHGSGSKFGLHIRT